MTPSYTELFIVVGIVTWIAVKFTIEICRMN